MHADDTALLTVCK